MTDKDFNIEIAGEVIRIKPLFDCAYDFCKNYLTQKKESAQVVTTPADIEFERNTGENDGLNIPKDYPDSYLELLAIYRKAAGILLEKDILLIHGSGISFDGKGMIFLADSGTGKSTHSTIWQQTFGDRVVMINDDKPLVKITDGGAFIYGTPWSGKNGLNTNTCAPLKVMCEIVRSGTDETRVEMADESAVWKILMQQTFKDVPAEGMPKILYLLDKLQEKVPLRRIVCSPNPDAAEATYRGLRDILE